MWVRAKVDCFPADGSFRKAGEEFEYSGPKNENLAPVKKAPDPEFEEMGKQAE